MHLRGTWRTAGKGLCLCTALAAMLPLALGAQTQQPPQNQQPPQGRLPVGFPGFRGGANSRPAPVAPAPAKPSAATPMPASAAVPASQLPATPVTQTAIVAPVTPAVPLTPAQNLAHRATVTYENGRLTVKAHNSSLNQILRAIMRETGLQVDGGVLDERVYGVYGPSRPSAVLSNLLTGTGSDMLYIPASGDQPAHLTLVSRDGKTSPPPPSASASDDLLPDGPEEDPAPSQASVAALKQADPVQAPASTSNGPPPVMPPGTYPEQVEPPHKKVTSLPPPTVDQVYQQILQLHDAEAKLAQQQKAAAANAPAPAATPAVTPAATAQPGILSAPVPAAVTAPKPPVARE